ncbi:type I phosphoribosyltransferase [Roseibium marinum]|uniref:Uncharacterized protein n=1 Tax=Roseibium marinum TaxID=281252 RepID=A0A2S3UN23_9HYPH|nr:hypothetical protein [Roseibium marinum]POF28980.1 hypothetical protein CLV41_111232 [Roseibium marinum]
MTHDEVSPLFRKTGATHEGQLSLTSGLRGFDLHAGTRGIDVEDIVTTGLSSRGTVTSLKVLGAEVHAVACLIYRSGGEADACVPVIALAQYKVPACEPANLPPKLAALPATKPGCRGLN